MPTIILDTDHMKSRSIAARHATSIAYEIAEAIAEERERSAKIADSFSEAADASGEHGEVYIAKRIAELIRNTDND